MIRILLSHHIHLRRLLTKSEFIFVSVPTPSNADGSINLDIVNNLMADIANINTPNQPLKFY